MSVVSAISRSDTNVAAMIATTLAGLLGAASLLAIRQYVRETTLGGPWSWAGVGWGMACAVALGGPLGWPSDPATASALRLTAAAATLCFPISLLGARRPHQRAWHFVVLSLWLILAWPAAEVWTSGQPVSLGSADVRAWFLVLLLLLIWTNMAATRFAAAGTLLVAGQAMLLGEFLPWPGRALAGAWPAGCVCAAAASVLAAWQLCAVPSGPRSLDAAWREYRDLFGTLWGLRFVQRINAVARQSGWDVELTWWGFCDQRGAPFDPRAAPEIAGPLRQVLTNLLRRFVSAQWIATRLGQPLD